jgi:hypothetical protein
MGPVGQAPPPLRSTAGTRAGLALVGTASYRGVRRTRGVRVADDTCAPRLVQAPMVWFAVFSIALTIAFSIMTIVNGMQTINS